MRTILWQPRLYFTLRLPVVLLLFSGCLNPNAGSNGCNCSPPNSSSLPLDSQTVTSHPQPTASNADATPMHPTTRVWRTSSRLEDPATGPIEPSFTSQSNDADSWETTTSTAADTEPPTPTPPAEAQTISEKPFSSGLADIVGHKDTRVLRLANANNEFAFKLAKQLMKENPQGNIFFSPVALYSTLITILLGAAGQTATELRQVLGLQNFTETEIQEGFRDVLHSLQKDSAGEANSLKMLNALFVEKQSSISTKYTDRVRTYLNAYLEKVGFASEPEYVLDWVNKLVNWWTEGRITTLLDQPPDALTKLLLVNAVFFKGKWSETFDSRFTAPEAFTGATGEKSIVQMMKRTERFQVFCGNSTHLNETCAFELLYSGGSLSFLVLLPASGTYLSQVEGALGSQMMYDMISKLEERTLELGLPKLTLSTSYDLRDSLRSLGLKSAFEQFTADFSQMSLNSSGLYVSGLTHKNVLEVSEEGTVAASAAFASIGNRRKPGRLYVDRPFLLLVRDLKTDAILFFGRVTSLP